MTTKIAECPEKMAPEMFALIRVEFDGDEDSIDKVATKLSAHGINSLKAAKRLDLNNQSVRTELGLNLGEATALHEALHGTSNADVATKQPAAPQGDSGLTGVVSTLTSTLTSLLGGKLEELPMDKLLDRLIETGASDPTVISFAAESHVLLSKRGVVLKPGTEKIIDKAATLDYYRQPRSYLGDRWKNQRVVPVTGAFGVKEEFNPFNLNQPLQGGVDPNTDLDLNGVSAPIRNFFSFVAETKPNLVKDDGHALVEAIKEKGGLEGLKSHGRFGKVVTAYEEACGDDVSIATKYLPSLYRTPGDTRPNTQGGGARPPFPPAGSTPRVIRLNFNPGGPVTEVGSKLGAVRRGLTATVQDPKLVHQYATDANLPLGRIDFAGAVQSIWAAVLNEASHHPGKVERIIGLVLTEYPDLEPQIAEFLVNDSANSVQHWTPERTASLRDILMGLYDPDSALVIANDAGLERGKIERGSGLKTWDSILREANRTGRISRLIEIVKESSYGWQLTQAGF